MKRVIQISLDVLVEENYTDLIPHIENSVNEKGFEVCGIQQTDTSWTLEEYSKITGRKESNRVRIPYPYNRYFKVIEEFEEGTLKDEAVIAKLQGFTLLKADVTANNDDDKALQKLYGIVGPPGLIFWDKDKKEVTSSKIVGYKNPTDFLQIVNKNF